MFIIENGEMLKILKFQRVKPVIRFKSKISGNTVIKDLVQGERNISNSTVELCNIKKR